MGRNYHTTLREYVRDMCDATAANHVAEVATMLKEALERGGHEGLTQCLYSCLNSTPVVKHMNVEDSKRMRIDFCDALEDCLGTELRPLRNAQRQRPRPPSERFCITGSLILDEFLIREGRLPSDDILENRRREDKAEAAAKEKRKADRAAGAAIKRAKREEAARRKAKEKSK